MTVLSVILKIHTVDDNPHGMKVGANLMDEVLVECVPNFSEGRDAEIIDKITNCILSVNGVSLLDVDMGYDFNRTVITIVGDPESVLTAAIESSKIAYRLINMENHTGEHSRMGAVDVVPFIPLSNATLELCTELSERYAKEISSSCGIPIYLYGHAARNQSRISLPNIRKGEYEGIGKKIILDEWKPDYGPSIFIPKSGVTATGSRNMLIAYNVNLNTSDKSLANKISGIIRTSGILIKDNNGFKVLDEYGKPTRTTGIFPSLQAAGWMYDENTAQVSMNLLDYNITGLYEVTEYIKKEANKIGLEVISSELVGLVPLKAFINAGKMYVRNFESLNNTELVDAAITGLKLDIIGEFLPEEKIIEWSMNKGEREI